MLPRGRPKNAMTARRKEVLEAYADAIAEGYTPSLARIARVCGLHDYRDARRIVGDLRRLGAVAI